MLASRDDAYKGPRPITHPADMADFLQPRLLGILAFFDSQLLNSRIPIQDKKLVRKVGRENHLWYIYTLNMYVTAVLLNGGLLSWITMKKVFSVFIGINLFWSVLD